jgi:hypothetical protein
MRTVFVNPARPRSRKASTALARRPPAAPARRPRRRNAGITPFVASSNPALLLPNPARRSRRRRKNPQLNLRQTLELGLITLGGAGLAAAGDTFLASKISNPWARNGTRAAIGIASVAMLPREMGSAAAGAIFMPIAQELLAYFLGGVGPAAQAAQAAEQVAATEADLDLLAADLSDLAESQPLRDW